MCESNGGKLIQGNGKCSRICREGNDCDGMECGCNAESALLSSSCPQNNLRGGSSGGGPLQSSVHHQQPHSQNGKMVMGNGSSHLSEENEQKRKREGCCDKIEAYLEHLGRGTTWLAILFGQVASLLLTISAITCVYLTDVHRLHFPNAQNFSFYIVLATVFTFILACRPAERNLFPILKTRGWKYAFVALADAEANFLVTKSYQLTTLTSVQLLDCFAIPTVLSLSWLVLRIRFKVPHIVGVSVALLGLCCLVWADVEDGRPLPAGKNRFLGDMICLSGAFLHGVSNVAQEFVVKTFDVVEFLAMIGLFGSFISGAQTLFLEYGAVTSTEWTPESEPAILFVIHAGAQFMFYLSSALVMKWAGATALNLSLLTADFYCLIVGIFLFRVKVHQLYFLSFVLVMTGVLIFSIKPTIIASHIYKSLTREVTTTLDLELMASSPLYNHPPSHPSQPNHPLSNHNHQQKPYFYDPDGTDGGGTLRLGNNSSLLNNPHHPEILRSNNGTNSQQTQTLSSETCDVVPRQNR